MASLIHSRYRLNRKHIQLDHVLYVSNNLGRVLQLDRMFRCKSVNFLIIDFISGVNHLGSITFKEDKLINHLKYWAGRKISKHFLKLLQTLNMHICTPHNWYAYTPS